MQMKFKKTHPEAITPTRAKPGDSGLDLYACLPDGPVVIKSGDRKLIPTGVAVELPFTFDLNAPFFGGRLAIGWEAQVRPRSGLAVKSGVQSAFGTIDNGYRGEIGVTLFNFSWHDFTVRSGDRIAQLVVAPVVYPELVEVTELSETDRGVAGFGSTGV